MTGFSLSEMRNLSVLKREIHSGIRSEYITDPVDLARLSFVEWRLKQGLDCTCGRSDGGCCHCEDEIWPTNYG